MKKIYLRIIFISIILSVFFIINVYAKTDNIDDVENIEDIILNKETIISDDEGVEITEREMNLRKKGVIVDIKNNFFISIPKYIIIKSSNGRVKYKINVKGDISGNQVLNVIPKSKIKVKQNNKEITAIIKQADTQYTYKELKDKGTNHTGEVIIIKTNGEWFGNFNFIINLNTL